MAKAQLKVTNKCTSDLGTIVMHTVELLDADGVPVDKYKLEPNWYTNNFVYKALVTPMKKVFQSELPLAIKRNFSKLANDAGLTQVAAKLGDTLGMSVYTRAAVRNGEYVKAHDALRQLYSEHTGKNRNIIDIDFQKKGYHQWLEDTYTRILKQEPLSDLDKDFIPTLPSTNKSTLILLLTLISIISEIEL